MGYSVDVQEGRYERGSDLVVTVGSPLLPEEATSLVGVQVASFSGKVSGHNLQKKVDQLINRGEANELDFGVILTTGQCEEEALDRIEAHNSESERKIKVIDGKPLAGLFLRQMGSRLGIALEAVPGF